MDRINKQYIESKHISWIALILVSIVIGLLLIYNISIFIIVAIIGLINLIIIFKYPMWGLIAYIIIFLIRPGELFPAIAAVRPELLTGSLTIIALILHQKISFGKITIPTDRISISMIGILIAICVSIFTSYEKSETKDIAIMFVKLIMFFYMIITLINTKKRFITFVIIFVSIITYISFDAFLNYLSGGFIHTMDVDRLMGSTSAGGDPNTLGATIVTTIPLILALSLYFRNYFVKIIYNALVLFMTMMMVITASRSALLAFIASICVGVAYSKHKALNFVIVLVFIVIGWFLLPQQYHDRYMRFAEVGEDMNDVSSGRIEIWLSGLRMIPANPIFGVGAGAFAWANSTGEFGTPLFMQSHSLYIEIISTMGIVGVFAWLFYIITFFKRLRWLSLIRQTTENSWIVLFSKTFIIIISALLVSGLFGHNLYRYTWYMLAGLALALTNIYYNKYSTVEK